MLDAIRVVDQVSGPEKEAYAHDIPILPDHFQCKTQGIAPDLSRTPKQEMIGRPRCNLVVRQFHFPLLTSALIAKRYSPGEDPHERAHLESISSRSFRSLDRCNRFHRLGEFEVNE